MERKTMGSFLAALRKASGLTQKELAEKLNVSDKSVRRWERNEGAPDLALIPVIAEIFGITSNELLRGERKTEAESTPAQQSHTEKQRNRLFSSSLTSFRNKSLLAMGLALCGFIAALIGNFAFLRAYIGFFAGAVFFIAAIIVQVVCINSAFLTVSDEELPSQKVGHFRRKVVLLGETSITLSLTLFAVTLPLILWTRDAYVGLRGDSFLKYGLPFGLLTAAACAAASYVLNSRLFHGDGFAVDEKADDAYRRNHRLKQNCALVLAALLAVSAFVNGAATGFGDVGNLAKGTQFEDYDSFKAFMEQDVPAEENGYDSMDSAAALAPDSAITYYDQDGNMVSADEANTQTIEDKDGNILYSFVHRNRAVTSWRFGYLDGALSTITTFTEAQYREARQKTETINMMFVPIYLLEIAGVLFFYFRKRAK